MAPPPMDADRWRRIERLYHAALDRPAGERAPCLAEACAGDETLRREIEALLGAPATADSPFAQPAAMMAGGAASRPATSPLAGRRLGAYLLDARIGAGGMGEVYRARDTRLGRDVAIKILPDAFVADPDRLARFEREARALAALNHPNIATIHGFDELDGVRALIMELVDGETLDARIARGPVPSGEALTIAQQLVEALDAAHEKGIVHRDLKPANIKITPAGAVKVLDFGLAKAVAGDSTGDLTQALTAAGSREGLIVGTPAYMSPEQARGQAVDKRTDIWAFGSVLFEMVAGRAAFARETLTDTLAAVLQQEPDWTWLPTDTPARVRQLLRRCLEKDAKLRLRDIGDARFELAETRTPDTPPARMAARSRIAATAAAALSALALIVVGANLYFGGAPADLSVSYS